TFSGKVIQVRYSPEVVQNVVTYTTIVEVNNPEMKLRPGMTATVSIITGEAKNALRVPNAALRFTPPLSPEEMKKIMEDIGKEMLARKGARPTSAGSNQHKSNQPSRGQQPSFMFGSQAKRPKNIGRVWIEDDQGKLKLISIRTGVTDNTYTQVVRGNLKEGQLVITGISSGQEGKPGSSSSVRRRMMFFRR
ncbi:MAG: efflux RND transporter periplasmic adaptor subunit, partial [Candidatus Aminicenantales bacterium]